MQRFPVKILPAFTLLMGLLSFNACQKEAAIPTALQVTNPSSDRSPGGFTYGVTVYDGLNPSLIVEIDEATGAVTNQFQAAVLTPGGTLDPIEDLKGICRTSAGQYFITTGNGNTLPAYNNMLLKVNVNNPLPFPFGLGTCSAFNSICPTGPVSDLEYDPVNQIFIGLQNNSNQLIQITLDAFGNYTQYSAPIAVGGIAGRLLSGLTFVQNPGTIVPYLVGAASRPGDPNLAAQLYRIPVGGIAQLMTQLAPQANFAGGHCGIGFDRNLNHLAINRSDLPIPQILGLSEINPWIAALPLVTNTNQWGAQGFNFEDLSSYTF